DGRRPDRLAPAHALHGDRRRRERGLPAGGAHQGVPWQAHPRDGRGRGRAREGRGSAAGRAARPDQAARAHRAGRGVLDHAVTVAPLARWDYRDGRVALIVQKFGGTSVGSIDRIKNVAARALAAQAAGNEVVVIVSAMAGETNRLLKLAADVTPMADGREVDALAATGEQVTAAPPAIAIPAQGGNARSFPRP